MCSTFINFFWEIFLPTRTYLVPTRLLIFRKDLTCTIFFYSLINILLMKSYLISVKEIMLKCWAGLLPWGAALGRYFCKNTKLVCNIFLPTRLFSRFDTYTFINFQKLFPPTRLFGLHVYSVVRSIWWTLLRSRYL